MLRGKGTAKTALLGALSGLRLGLQGDHQPFTREGLWNAGVESMVMW